MYSKGDYGRGEKTGLGGEGEEVKREGIGWIVKR